MNFFDNTLISKQELFKKLQIILIGFGLLCLCSTIVLTNKEKYLSESLSFTGGKIGPLKGEDVYHVKLRQALSTNSWVFVETSVETDEGDALFSFGKELWNEAGYEYGERWQETQELLEYDFTVPEGTFYLNIEVPETKEKSDFTDVEAATINTNKIHVTIFKRTGSSMLMVIVAIISFLTSGVLYLIRQYIKLI